MNRVGIICYRGEKRHHLFDSYFYAVQNLYGTPKTISNFHDLDDVEMVFIGDDHYGYNKLIWKKDRFLIKANRLGIKIVVLTNERILGSKFPWNKEDYEILTKFEHLYHYANDADDCEMLGVRVNRTAPSVFFKDSFINCEKKDKMVFIGKMDCPMDSYAERKVLLNELKKKIDIDIFPPELVHWQDYVKLISGYRFIFSPLGNGNFFPMRFYEALACHSIPVHQVKDNTLKYYDIEAGFNDCIFFKDIEELPEKLKSCTLEKSHNMIWMEENLRKLLMADGLL